MAIYAIYKYVFTVPEQGNLFSTKTGLNVFDDAQRHFANVLKESMTIPGSMLNDDEEEDYTIEPFHCHDDVMVLLVCNVKHNRYREKLVDKEFTSHPGCFVIVDNRPGVTMMAIEKSTAFNGKTEKVRNLLLIALKEKLDAYGLTIDINARIRPGTFWEIVNTQCRQLKDIVKKVCFNFPNPSRQGPIDADEEMKDRLAQTAAIIGAVNAVKGTLTMEGSENDPMVLEEKVEDLAQMVRLCEADGYDMSVHFKQYGVYRYGADAQVYMNLDETIFKNFINGVTELGLEDGQQFSFYAWLNNNVELTKNCKDDTPTAKQRRKSRKK